ncbi:DNA alkylation repair protein [Actinorugispora endophytica]|uniref:3-methyladenine DNA glycosylase AlkD n=1 Tax=Actinorugispora endophytica TaxID=1605990 RepID=A0A4R6V1A3_9ACTN|nr:DNA alkylation repair protein [Actinorugispora endophytica]TDQ52150.1 3-methyladenine DNA glycosylase AlkD [Actinorugispora endophytica]
MPAHLGLIAAVRDRLRRFADPGKADSMRRYMKSVMPFHGVQAGPRRRVFAEVFAANPIEDQETWEDTVRTLWRVASHREERYAAVELTGHRLYTAFQTPATAALYEDLITAGAWWDYVDPLAVNRVGPLLRAHPTELRPLVSGWALAGDLWLRRSAILCQVGAGAETDADLLLGSIEPNLRHPDFFVRKAIGWALREYARTDPGSVLKFVDEHESRISALSRREALRNLR